MLTLADGTQIDPNTRKPLNQPRVDRRVREHAAPSANKLANERRHSTRMRINELPCDPKTANVYGVVLFYVLMGIPDLDILDATGMSPAQLKSIKGSDAFDELRSKLVGAVREAQTSEVRGIIANASAIAAETIVSLMDSSDEKIALAAAKDIMDRDGHRPADVVEHRHAMDGEMRIRIIRDQRDETPVIDLNAEEV